MFNKLAFMLTKLLAWLKKNRNILPEKDSEVKINLGSGLAVAGDWYNIDAGFNVLFAKFPVFIIKFIYKHTGAHNWYLEHDFISKLKGHRFLHHKLEYGIPFEDESVDYVYSSHFLEHIFRDEALKIIKESFRVLKYGGVIRVCVPDLDYALKIYNEGEKEKALEYFFPPTGADYLSRHQYMYDYEMMKNVLESAGFVNVKKCSYKTGKTPDIEQLDCRPEETLYMEGEKK